MSLRQLFGGEAVQESPKKSRPKQLGSTIANLENVSQNLQAANSRIRDADFASETSTLTKSQILQQAGISMLAQANASQQNVLSLLG